ncbi:aconitate hydratase [Solibacillus isronensis]|uniref:aconitate hydratase n=1 Tax=Solibacillus isronensis TaxID=412383 RepID=UPI0007FB59E2|nr:aconitate hydratase [Solibacillus silvestris]OBW54620.1 aconitate hydratase [Solibacillus silvestris]
MIKAEERQLLHKYLLIELAVKSLQIDYQMAEQFKMKVVFLPFIDALIKDLRKEYIELKTQLAQQRIRVVEWRTVDEYFSDVQVATAGNDIVLRYANQALKTQVEKLLLTQIHNIKPNN